MLTFKDQQVWTCWLPGRPATRFLFRDGQVKHHEDYSLTMESAVNMYLKYEPHVGVVEQVKGFIMPLASGDNATPYDRPAERVSGFVLQFFRLHVSVCWQAIL